MRGTRPAVLSFLPRIVYRLCYGGHKAGAVIHTSRAKKVHILLINMIQRRYRYKDQDV
jgi:hypothetical protein